MQEDTASGLIRSQELSAMSADLMQQNMQAALPANLHLEQLDLNQDITSLEEVEEIVKSNLLKMRNDSNHDGYSYNEYHDDDDVTHDDDLLKMMNLQISDLDIFETPSAEDAEKHQIISQEIPKSALGCSEISEIAQENSQMPQSAEDLLEDITLVINSDKKFATNCNSSVKATTEQSGRDLQRPDLQEARTVSGATIRETSPSSMHQTSNTNHRNSEAIESYYRNNEILKSNFQTLSSNVNGGCNNWSPQSKRHSSVALKPPPISREASSDSSKSVDIIPDNSSVDGSYINPEYHPVMRSSIKHPPGHRLEAVTHPAVTHPAMIHPAVTHPAKIRNMSNMQRRQFGGGEGDDVTVDGEDEETCRRESVELCPLTYDENLMCSFDELQLHQDEDSELVAHGNGTRGRPARSKVVKPAVLCRIEPKISRSETAAQKALYPPMISATGQRFPGTYSSMVPAGLQPHREMVTQRFPVVLHNDPNSNSQVYLEVFPKTSDPNLTRPTSSPSHSLRSSPSRSVRGKSVDRARDETMDLENEGSNNFEEASTQPFFKRDTRDVYNKPQLSLEVDGPIHHQMLPSQARAEKSDQMTNCYRDQSFSNGSTSEVPLSVQGPSQNHCNTMSSDISQHYMFNPRSFPTSSHSLTGAGHYRNTSAAVWQGNQSGQASIPLFSSIQAPVPANQRIPTSQTFNNLTSQTSSLHSQMHQGTHYNNFGIPANSFHYSPYCDRSQLYGNWSGQPSISSGPVSVGSQYASHDPSRQAFVSGAAASTSSPVKSAGGFPSTLADPRSKRWRMLLEMGNPGLKQAQADGSRMMMSGSFEGAVPQQPVQRPGVSTAASHYLPEEASVRSQMQGQVKQKQQREPHQGHANLPAGATPGNNVTEKKKHIQSRSVPSHSSNRSSSKGPEIPVPVERSKKRVQSWLENNIMFRPDLDSGTFDPSDHSLKPEPSLPGTARLYPSNAVVEQGQSDQTCKVVGISGKSIVLPQPADMKQQATKKRITKPERAREPALRQITHKTYSIASNSSVISEPSCSPRNRSGSKERENLHRNSPSSFSLGKCPLKPSGKTSPYSEIMAPKNGLEDQGRNKVVQGSLLAQEQAPLGEYQVDDKQMADMEIAERLKQIQQIISSIASTAESSHVLSELGQFLLANSGSGNNQNSLKMEATVSDSSKSSFDASKYITLSEIESLEKKKAQTGKSSLDGYLDHVRNSSNDSMGSLPNPTQVTDVKPLVDIPLKDIVEIIGSSGEFGHQLPEPVPCGPPHLVLEHRQKAMKRKTLGNQAESAFLNGQTITSAVMVHNNQSSDSLRALEGSGPSIQPLNHKTSSTSSHQTSQPSDKTGPNQLMNSGKTGPSYLMNSDKTGPNQLMNSDKTGPNQLMNSDKTGPNQLMNSDQRLAECNAEKVSEAWTAEALSCPRDQSSTRPSTSTYGETMGLVSQTYTTSASFFEADARPLYGSYTNQDITPATRPLYGSYTNQDITPTTRPLYGSYTNQEVAPSSISDIPRSQNVLQDLTTPSRIFNPEVNTSMEISVSGGSISDPAMFMDTTFNQSGSFPIPGSQVNEAQHLLKSGQPGLIMLQQLSSLSSSSLINDSLFKKPQAVVGHKKGASFPSMEGDSDVSMASEKSLSGNLALLETVGPPEKNLPGNLTLLGTVGPPVVSKHDQLLFLQNYLQQQQQQLNLQQFVPSVLSRDQQLNHQQLNHQELNHQQLNHQQLNHQQLNHQQLNHQELNHQQLNHQELNHQQLNHQQFIPTALNQELQLLQQKNLQMQTLQRQHHQIPSQQQQQHHQIPSQQQHHQIPSQQQQQHHQIPSQQQQQQYQIPSQQQQQHHQIPSQQQQQHHQIPSQQQQQHHQIPSQQQQQHHQIPSQQQQQHHQIPSQQQIQAPLQQQMQIPSQQQQQQQTHAPMQPLMRILSQQQQYVQTPSQQQQQYVQTPSQQQQQYVQTPSQQQQQHVQTPSQQMHPQKTQVAPKHMQIPPNQPQQMHHPQQAPQQTHNPTTQPQTQHFLTPKPNATNFQGPTGTSTHSVQPQEPLHFLLSATAQTGIQERSASGLFNLQQHSRIVHEKDSTTSNPSNVLLSSAYTSATTSETQLHTQGIQHHFGEAFPGSSSAHPAFINTLVDQSFGSRMSSVESSSGDTKDNGQKNSAESQLQQYLIGRFPSLDFGDVCQDKLSLSLRTPSSGQNKSNQSVDDPANAGKITGQTGKVQSAERSREEGDSDLSVFSVGSDEEMLSFKPDNDGETPLHLLCDLPKEMREKMSTFSSIPGFSGALNLQNKNQETALHIAVKNEDVEVTRFLVSHGADVNIFCLSSQKVNRNKTSRAVCRNETVQQTALHEAVELGNTEIVNILLTSQNIKMDSRRPDTGLLTPLMLALQIHRQSDRRDIVLELIKQGAQLNLQDTIQGKTPLMFAIQSKDVLLVEQILQQVGAERARQLVNERAKNDMTCLHFAAEGHLESALRRKLLRCIIVAGGDASARNSEGETPRDWARADINEVLQNLSRLSSP